MSPLNRLALTSIGTGAIIGAVLGFIFGGFTAVSALYAAALAVSLVGGGLIGADKEEDPGYDDTMLPRLGICFSMVGGMLISWTGVTFLLHCGAVFLGVMVCGFYTWYMYGK
jgi:hypothetical protein